MTDGTRLRGPYAKTAARRQKILSTARTHFARGGYLNSSLKGIAAELQMSQAGVLYHFPTKENLLAAVLQAREDEMRHQISELDPGIDASDTYARVLELNMQEPELVRLWAVLTAEATAPEHPAHSYVTTWYEKSRAEAAAGLAMAQAAGLIDPAIDTIHTATNILAIMDGLLLQWLLNPDLDIVRIFRPLAIGLFPPAAR